MKGFRLLAGILLLVMSVILTGAGPAPQPTSRPPQPPDPDAAKLIRLPAPCTEFHAADGGRKIVFYFKSARKLLIADVLAEKLVGEIAVPGDNASFACTRDRILLVLPEQKLIQSYDLATLKRLKTARTPSDQPFLQIRAGSTSAGPAYMWFGGELIPVSPETLAPTKLSGKLPGGGADGWFHYRVSADGTTVTAYQTHSSPADYQILRVRDGNATIVNGPQAFSMANRTFTPTADGSYVLYGNAVYDRQAHDVPAGTLKEFHGSVPSSDPRFFFGVKQTSEKGGVADVAIVAANDRQILGVIEDVAGIASSRGWETHAWGAESGGEPRLILLPQQQIFAAIPESGDQVEVRHISFKSMVGAEGGPGLAVISLPPAETAVGRAFSYSIETAPEHAGTKCKLESGPDGMTVSLAGVVTWTPSDRPIGGKADVIVSVADDAGHEVMHSFSLEVLRGGGSPTTTPSAIASKDSKPNVNGANPATEKPQPTPSTKIAKADEHRIELPSGNYRYTPGLDVKSVLLLCGNQFATLAADGFTIRQVRTLPKPYIAIAERREHYVAVAGSPPTLDILDKTTLKPIRSRVLPGHEPCDLVLHPTLPLAYVAQIGPGKPLSKFVIVNETNVEAREDRRWIGQWLAMSPDGSFMMAGYRDIYQDGHDIIDNPDRIWIVPKYGNIDYLIRYDLRGDGLPGGATSNEEAGGNGTGIRMSEDGKRVTYLSHVGSPQFSGNLSGWDPRDLTKIGVSYATKDIASTQDAAFHPLLPIFASPGKGSVVVFDRESGAIQSDRVKLDDIGSAGIEHVFFSPDGRQIVLDTVVNAIHYLYHSPLILSEIEKKQLAAPRHTPRQPEKDTDPPAQRVDADMNGSVRRAGEGS